MGEYAVSTNLISWVPIQAGIFGWPAQTPEAELIEAMDPGDYLVPKFSQNPDYRRSGSQAGYVKGICEVLGRSYEDELAAYIKRVDNGNGAVPFVMRVTKRLGDDGRFPSNEPWTCVAVEIEELEHPISTSEFLRLRVVPVALARQFKATAAAGRHVQTLSAGAAEAMLQYGKQPQRDAVALRRLSLVWAPDVQVATELLREADRGPDEGDLAFLASENVMPGFHSTNENNELVAVGPAIERGPAGLGDLFEQARQRATSKDNFRPGNPVEAAKELAAFIDSEQSVLDIAEFPAFYDRYVILDRKVSQALELSKRPVITTTTTTEAGGDEEEGGEDAEQLELDNLHGLTVAAVRNELPGIVLPHEVLAEAVTALRSGKHILLSGPPGTGKSTVATALCRAVVGSEHELATATADWTTFDTIGGYMPRSGGGLEFEPGLIMRCLERGRWLVIDELNRADIDKAFGPLFTLLAGSAEDGAGQEVVLPFRKGEQSIRIAWAERRSDAQTPYAVTPAWRLIGTLNVRDKASLFQLSFAFLRRFAVIEVPLPAPAEYEALFASWVASLTDGVRDEVVAAAMAMAFGRRPLGPAILKDIAAFTTMAVTETETSGPAAPYADAVTACLTATRLYAAPQYEGATKADTDDLLTRLRAVWPQPPETSWAALEQALADVRLT